MSWAIDCPGRSSFFSCMRGVFLPSHLLAFLLLLWAVPLWVGLKYFGFEHRRWQESDHAD